METANYVNYVINLLKSIKLLLRGIREYFHIQIDQVNDNNDHMTCVI